MTEIQKLNRDAKCRKQQFLEDFKATNNGDSTTMALVQRISQQIINAIKT